jgi:hypothetical protein
MSLSIKISGGKAPADLNRFLVGMRSQGYLAQSNEEGILLSIPISSRFMINSGGWMLLVKDILVHINDKKLRLQIRFRSQAILFCIVCLAVLFTLSMHNASIPSGDLQKLLVVFVFGGSGSALIIVLSLLSSIKRDIKKAILQEA